MAVGSFFSLQPRLPRTSFSFYKFFYPTISGRISVEDLNFFRIVILFFTFCRVQLVVQHNQLFPDLIKQEETLLIKQAMHYLLKKLDWNLR